MLNHLCLNQEITLIKEVSLLDQHKGGRDNMK